MSYYNGPKIITDDLVFFVDAGNTKSYPGSGTTWYDMSGKGYDVTLYNTPAFSSGYLQFRAASSTSQYGTANFGEGVLKTESTSWTIETIFKFISSPSSNEAVVAGRSGCHGGIYLWSGDRIFNAIKTNDCWNGAINTDIYGMSTNGIYQAVMTYSGGSIRSYINGNFISTTSMNTSTYDFYGYGDTFYIGGIPSGGPPQNYATNTDIAIVRCYSRQLSALEIIQNFNANKSRFGL